MNLNQKKNTCEIFKIKLEMIEDSSREQQRAAESGREQQRAAESSREQQRAAESSREQQKEAERSREQQRTADQVPESSQNDAIWAPKCTKNGAKMVPGASRDPQGGPKFYFLFLGSILELILGPGRGPKIVPKPSFCKKGPVKARSFYEFCGKRRFS